MITSRHVFLTEFYREIIGPLSALSTGNYHIQLYKMRLRLQNDLLNYISLKYYLS